MNSKTGFSEYSEGIAHIVFAPDYDLGRWAVYFRDWKRECTNKDTAEAWAKYFRRNLGDGWTASVGKIIA